MIFRICKDRANPYVMVNKGFIYDPDISAKAKGILLYLLSRPDDWKVYQSEVAKHFTDGIKSIRCGIQELMTAKYIARERYRDEDGKLRHMIYQVYESPAQPSQGRVSDHDWLTSFERQARDTEKYDELTELALAKDIAKAKARGS